MPEPTSSFADWPRQRSLRAPIGCVGVGIHTGSRVALTLLPAPAGTGIVFIREDMPGSAPIHASLDAISDTRRCTQISGADGASVQTIEHLMAALASWGIDNVIVEVSGPELPAMDGSARPFLLLLECAGIAELDEPRPMLEILRPITVHHGERWARFEPFEGYRVDAAIVFEGTVIGTQRYGLDVDPLRFKRDVASARTFGFFKDVEALRQSGLARGGSLDNAVVVTEDGVLNPEGLRFPDEFVRHKVLDAIGDLHLSGSGFFGRFVGHGSGHMLHAKLLSAVLNEPSAHRWHAGPSEASMFDGTMDELRVRTG